MPALPLQALALALHHSARRGHSLELADARAQLQVQVQAQVQLQARLPLFRLCFYLDLCPCLCDGLCLDPCPCLCAVDGASLLFLCSSRQLEQVPPGRVPGSLACHAWQHALVVSKAGQAALAAFLASEDGVVDDQQSCLAALEQAPHILELRRGKADGQAWAEILWAVACTSQVGQSACHEVEVLWASSASLVADVLGAASWQPDELQEVRKVPPALLQDVQGEQDVDVRDAQAAACLEDTCVELRKGEHLQPRAALLA